MRAGTLGNGLDKGLRSETGTWSSSIWEKVSLGLALEKNGAKAELRDKTKTKDKDRDKTETKIIYGEDSNKTQEKTALPFHKICQVHHGSYCSFTRTTNHQLCSFHILRTTDLIQNLTKKGISFSFVRLSLTLDHGSEDFPYRIVHAGHNSLR